MINNILITGDDGYNSIGIRLLVYLLKDQFNLKIAATKKQASSTGGKLSINAREYGVTDIDGIEALWVDGTPVDAIEVAQARFGSHYFDLIISGINAGGNVGFAWISSGTIAAAIRALGLYLAPNAIAISWDGRVNVLTNESEVDIDQYLSCPGEMAIQIIQKAIDNSSWNARLLNINLPSNHTDEYRFTRLEDDLRNCYVYPLDIKNGLFSRSFNTLESIQSSEDTDIYTLKNGMISVTPCDVDLLNHTVFRELPRGILKL